MQTYLAVMEPKNPYTFSTDQKSKYAESKDSPTGKESYYIESYQIPEQTTVWGMLRLLILEQANLAHSSFTYTDYESIKIKQLIGEESFRFTSEKEQDFGALKWISPVFLCEYDNKDNIQYIVKNPMCNNGENGFSPLKMKQTVGTTDFGSISIPTDFDAKSGVAGGYVNLASKKIYSDDDLFQEIVQAGNRKNEAGKLKKKDNDAFFRKIKYILKNDEGCNRGFAFFVCVENIELFDDIVTIGAGKNVFSIRFIEKEADIEEQLKNWGRSCSDRWGYALSDIVVQQVPEYKDFSIVGMRSMRNITTKNYSEKSSYHERFKRSSERTIMIQRGSVFYNNRFNVAENKNLEKLGYNQIIEIGGKLNESSYDKDAVSY